MANIWDVVLASCEANTGFYGIELTSAEIEVLRKFGEMSGRAAGSNCCRPVLTVTPTSTPEPDKECRECFEPLGGLSCTRDDDGDWMHVVCPEES